MKKRSTLPIIMMMCSILLCACNNNGKSMKTEYAEVIDQMVEKIKTTGCPVTITAEEIQSYAVFRRWKFPVSRKQNSG